MEVVGVVDACLVCLLLSAGFDGAGLRTRELTENNLRTIPLIDGPCKGLFVPSRTHEGRVEFCYLFFERVQQSRLFVVFWGINVEGTLDTLVDLFFEFFDVVLDDTYLVFEVESSGE